ncbi:M56 family metallopeptidase [Kineosporia sp. R_H_3]|uniref:M56 family metallopeptidase n=1 Tax=Kineosporia sp. R_H_3 TaxID=1961848 RepID=UPI001E4344A0|nr:M56 family metallopeptidase [Kineosporia sp. R_H_3]
MLLSSLTSLVLAGLLTAAPDSGFTVSLADLMHACAAAVEQAYRAPGDALLHTGGAVLAFGTIAWVPVQFAVYWWSLHRHRARHTRHLRLIARPGPLPGVVVLDHHVPAAYCLGGRRGVVVLTSAALVVLDAAELEAVLAHEAAHRAGRHHLVLTVTRALSRCLALLPTARRAVSAVHELLEMVADDAAVAAAGSGATRSALLKIAVPGFDGRQVMLAAGDTAVLLRLRRLQDRPRPLQRISSVAMLAAGLAVATLPLLVAAAPALTAVRWDYCPLS